MELFGRQPNFQQNHPGVDRVDVPAGGGSSSHDDISGVQKSAWLRLTHVVPRDPLLERSFLRLETISWPIDINHVQLIGSVITGVPNAFSYLGTSTCWSLKGWMPSSTNSCQTRIAVSWLPKPSEVLVSPVPQMVGRLVWGVIVAIVIPRSWMGFQL